MKLMSRIISPFRKQRWPNALDRRDLEKLESTRSYYRLWRKVA